jgi:hypothetical protein
MSSRASYILDKLHESGSGVHAILLYGPRGAGKGELAKSLIINWLGNDRARQAYERGANPDVLHISPKGPSRIIKIGQIVRGTSTDDDEGVVLSEFLRTQPLYSGHKVAWMSDCDRMNDAATNSLLKPLEEPAEYAKLILTTTTISAIRQTILSRCLVIACELPDSATLTTAFPESTQTLRELSEGAPGVLREMMDQTDIYVPIASFADALVAGQPENVLAMSGKFREIVDALDDRLKLGARASSARCLELLAVIMTRRYPTHGHITESLLKAHKRIEGNASNGLVFDATFAEILVK